MPNGNRTYYIRSFKEDEREQWVSGLNQLKTGSAAPGESGGAEPTPPPAVEGGNPPPPFDGEAPPPPSQGDSAPPSPAEGENPPPPFDGDAPPPPAQGGSPPVGGEPPSSDSTEAASPSTVKPLTPTADPSVYPPSDSEQYQMKVEVMKQRLIDAASSWEG